MSNNVLEYKGRSIVLKRERNGTHLTPEGVPVTPFIVDGGIVHRWYDEYPETIRYFKLKVNRCTRTNCWCHNEA
jgi:hypothetical protein